MSDLLNKTSGQIYTHNEMIPEESLPAYKQAKARKARATALRERRGIYIHKEN